MCLVVKNLDDFKKADKDITVYKIADYRILFDRYYTPYRRDVIYGNTITNAICYKDYYNNYYQKYDVGFDYCSDNYAISSGVIHCFKYLEDAINLLQYYKDSNDLYRPVVIKTTIPTGTLYIEGVFPEMFDKACIGAKAVKYDLDNIIKSY